MTAENYNSRTADKFVIRMPEGMRQSVSQESKSTHVSMNSFIIQSVAMRLEKETRLDNLIKLLELALTKESLSNLKTQFAIDGTAKPQDLKALASHTPVMSVA